MMNLPEVIAFVNGLENVQQEANFGYTFFFVGDDHRLPFVSVSDADSDYDRVSHLDREGVFRVNIGMSRATFNMMFPEPVGDIDYSVLDVFLPHPEYAKQHFICILNPAGENVARMQAYIVEAHGLAAGRLQSRRGKTE